MDIETGQMRDATRSNVSSDGTQPCCSPSVEDPDKPRGQHIESFRQGYPRFSALIAADESFYVCPMFSRTRARLLLLKSDKVAMLRDKLDAIDQAETKPLFLGASRLDRNAERSSTLHELDCCLADFDSFVERTIRVLDRKPASTRARENLRNWLNTKGCISREESAFLGDTDDLMALRGPSDGVTAQLEGWVEDTLIRFSPGFRKRRAYSISSDENVFIDSGSLIHRVARLVFVMAMTVMMLAPVVICDLINDRTSHIVIIVISNVINQLGLASLAGSKTIELFIAGATYSTLLIVFLGGTGSSSS